MKGKKPRDQARTFPKRIYNSKVAFVASPERNRGNVMEAITRLVWAIKTHPAEGHFRCHGPRSYIGQGPLETTFPDPRWRTKKGRELSQVPGCVNVSNFMRICARAQRARTRPLSFCLWGVVLRGAHALARGILSVRVNLPWDRDASAPRYARPPRRARREFLRGERTSKFSRMCPSATHVHGIASARWDVAIVMQPRWRTQRVPEIEKLRWTRLKLQMVPMCNDGCNRRAMGPIIRVIWFTKWSREKNGNGSEMASASFHRCHTLHVHRRYSFFLGGGPKKHFFHISSPRERKSDGKWNVIITGEKRLLLVAKAYFNWIWFWK